MKKITSIALALIMIASLLAVSISAADPEGTPITNAAEFAAMTADGVYYLANDITLDATWNAGAAVSATYKENTAFTGTLDGNGKTVTTTAPLFANLQGTVKNLTIAGTIDGNALYCGAVSMWTNGTLTVENVTNKATITNASTVGGMLGYCATGTEATFTNCVNDADLVATSQIGGIVGYVQDYTVTITNCVNNGNLTTDNYGAGIIGRFGRDKAAAPKSVATIIGCTNNGNVNSTKSQCGGILGYLVGEAIIKNCVNNGDVANKGLTAAGIFGAVSNTADISAITIENCVNYGKISSSGIAGGIGGRVGRANPHPEKNYYIKNCVNFGEIVVTAPEAHGDSMYVGGIAGYAWGGSANGLINCVNSGNITVDSTLGAHAYDYCVGGILGYVNSSTYECKNNVNAGAVATTGEYTSVALTVYNKNAEATAIANNYSVAIAGIAVANLGDKAADPATFAEATAFATAVEAAQIENGTVAGLINEAAGETIYYQAIGTDKAPVLSAAEDGSNAIVKNADGTFGNPVKEPETTEPAPETTAPAPETTEPGSSSDTGDSFVIFAVIAAISVLGVAVVAKRREN